MCLDSCWFSFFSGCGDAAGARGAPWTAARPTGSDGGARSAHEQQPLLGNDWLRGAQTMWEGASNVCDAMQAPVFLAPTRDVDMREGPGGPAPEALAPEA